MDALQSMSADAGEIICTKAQLAEHMEACVSTVDFGVRELRRAGALAVMPQYDESGAQLGNLYCILADIGTYVERRGRPRKNQPE